MRRAILLGVALIVSALASGCDYGPGPKDQSNATRQFAELTAEIRPGSEDYAAWGRSSVIIRFHNVGPIPVSILKPLDGSTYEWHMPYYRLTVRDTKGEPLELSPRCGNSGLWADTEWPRDYLVPIKPKASYDVEVPLPCTIRKDGRYTVSFEYVYEPEEERFSIPPSAWRGIVRAEPVELDLKKDR
jgi:hypothetical protein